MASRYLLIEFEDEASALKLKSQIENATRAGKRFRVVGLFAKPQAPYCACPPDTQVTTKTQASRLKRGKKFGWWVCTVCKRPAQNNASLVNLMKPRDIIGLMRWDNWSYSWFNYFSNIGPSTLSSLVEDRINEQ